MTDFTTVKKNLESKRFRVSTFATAEEAADYLDRSIDGVSVGIGGSVTAEQMGLYEKLSGHNRVFWHWRPESAADPRREAMTADMYITSVNGMAETGELINIPVRPQEGLVHRGTEQAGPHLRGGPLAGAEHCRTEECPAAGPENALRRSWRSLL